ncbi:MAG: FAD-dependent monooxygenase [Hyphomicrobiaceae bacterium]
MSTTLQPPLWVQGGSLQSYEELDGRPVMTDVAIAGGSFAGLALALALARCLDGGLAVTVVDRGGRSDVGSAGPDPRAVALSASSRRMLEALGLWKGVASSAQPVQRIEITDSSLDAGIRPVLLAWNNRISDGKKTGEVSQEETAAHIVPLHVLGQVLGAAVAAERSITVIRPAEVVGINSDAFFIRLKLADNTEVPARLAVGADGHRSVLRDRAGIKSVGWPYAQVGIATTVVHERDHDGVAVQHFLPAGPFAILPLPGRRSCVTWTESETEGRRIMALDDDGFLAELDRRFGGRLGELRLDGGRRCWPLSMHLARRYVSNRLALVGDAAHGVHPIAGQGLNLAFRDVAALTETIVDGARNGLDIGDATMLTRYERWRRFDATAATAAFDAINILFSRDGRLTRSVREAGLQLVDRFPVLKRELVREAAGVTGELPLLLQGKLA